MRPEKKSHPWPKPVQALVQSACTGLFVLLAFLAIYRFHNKLAIASLAASAFIAFGFPQSASAREKVLLGGYACGVVSGVLCCLVLAVLQRALGVGIAVTIGFCALSVFLTAFSMILLGVQHPPATALALSMVLEPRPLAMGFTMLLCMVTLCLVKWLVVRLLGRRFG